MTTLTIAQRDAKLAERHAQAYPDRLCECGCGATTPRSPRWRNGYRSGEPMRFVTGHGSHTRKHDPAPTVTPTGRAGETYPPKKGTPGWAAWAAADREDELADCLAVGFGSFDRIAIDE